MRRALVVCPGRGSYDRAGLGQLQDRSDAVDQVLDAADAFRTAAGRPTIRELDSDERYRTTRHVAGEHASLLTFACSLADLADLARDRFEIVGVTGNSMGFYTALAAAGALPLDDAIRLVDTMGAYQKSNVIGGQILYPACDADWSPSPALIQTIETTLQAARDAGHSAHLSIDLGGFYVLGADKAGLGFLLQALPEEKRGTRSFPVQLPLHSAFHTPLMTETSERALLELGDLPLCAPQVPLIDGRGAVHRPRWTDPEALRDYTLRHQVVAPFDFTTAVSTALRHCAPDVVIALGPGNSLGGPLARILTWEGWSGIRSRADLDARRGEDALLLSFGVGLQRPKLVA